MRPKNAVSTIFSALIITALMLSVMPAQPAYATTLADLLDTPDNVINFNGDNAIVDDPETGYIVAIKYEDLNGDGGTVYGQEPRLDDWVMTVKDDQGNVVATGTTGANGLGRVEFHGLPIGIYTVCETPQAGWINTEPSSDVCRSARVRFSGDKGVARFGNYELGHIVAIKYEDLNGNGTPEYPDEPRLDGWVMTLKDDEGNVIATGITGANGTGRVEFHDLPIGIYTVCETPQAGWINTEPGSDVCRSARVRFSDDKGVARFGNAQYSKILVSKYEDLNLDGKRNYGGSAEPGVEDWEFVLYDAGGNQLALQDTGPAGWTTFKDLEPGDYTICEVEQSGWTNSDPGVMDPTYNAPCETITLISDGKETVKFGNYRLDNVTIDKSFTSASILPGGTSTMLFTITNGNPIALTGLNFSDTFPGDLQVAATPNYSTTCTGVTLSSGDTAGHTSFVMTAGTVNANSSCTLQVDMTSSSLGSHVNTTGIIDASETTGEKDTASATLNVVNGPVVLFGVNTIPANGATLTTGPAQLFIEFNKELDPTSAQDLLNYLLLEEGTVAGFQTVDCDAVINGSGVDSGDVEITIESAFYSNAGGTYLVTLGINAGNPLPVGSYQLYMCGTTSIEDTFGLKLNDGLSDTLIDFTVQSLSDDGRDPVTLPETGFRHGSVTALPKQPTANAYVDTAMMLEIPKIGVSMSIVGVPVNDGEWDVTWLGNNAGYLAGSAFPTWAGNTVITGHVWDAWNQPGNFSELKTLNYGDQVQIKAWGQTYTYEVRESKLVTKKNVMSTFQSEDYDWVTLVTCEFYNPFSGDYLFRRSVRAVLVSVK